MNPAQLSTLLAILDEGSFEAAAAHLGITPSAVSQRIKALEKQVGRILIHRTTPPTATEAGEVLVQAARRMALLQAETDARLRERLDRVPLSIAVNADSVATWFSPVFRSVAKAGEATLRMRIEDEAHTLNLLRRGDVMGAVTRESQPVSGCDSLPLGVMHYRAVGTAELRDSFRLDNGELDWAAMPALRFGPRDALQDEDLHGRVQSATLGQRRISNIPSSEAFVKACCAGLGWALVPELQCRPLVKSGELVCLDDEVLSVELHWQRWRLESRLLEGLTRAVVDAAHQVLEQKG